MKESVLIPHPNEAKKLALAQKSLCAAALEAGLVCAPSLPLFVRFLPRDQEALAGVKQLSCRISPPAYSPEKGAFVCRAQVRAEKDGGEQEAGTEAEGWLQLATVLAPAEAVAVPAEARPGQEGAAGAGTGPLPAESGDVAAAALAAGAAPAKKAGESGPAVAAALAATADVFPLQLPVCRIGAVEISGQAGSVLWQVAESRWVKKSPHQKGTDAGDNS